MSNKGCIKCIYSDTVDIDRSSTGLVCIYDSSSVEAVYNDMYCIRFVSVDEYDMVMEKYNK